MVAGYCLFPAFLMPALPPPPATDRLRFSGEVPVPTRLAACKEFLKVETAALRARHEAGATGLATTHHRAALIDALLTHLFNYAIDAYARNVGPLPAPVALVALGGAEAFTPLVTGPVLRTRTAPPVCSLSATADTSVSRRSVLSSVVFAAAGLAAP
jgi:hypothetical protein